MPIIQTRGEGGHSMPRLLEFPNISRSLKGVLGSFGDLSLNVQ